MDVQAAITRVLDEVERQRDFPVELARELMRVPTVNPKFEEAPGINREPEAQDIVAARLAELDMTTTRAEVFAGRPNVAGSWAGSAERSLAINGHIDVVPVGDQAAWSVDPFGAEIHDGRLYGRGGYDMKAGIAAGIAAAKALRDCGIELDGRFEIHSVVDEEAGGFGTKDLLRDPDRVPSAVIVGEPTEGQIMPCQPGLEWVRVTIRGRNAHAGWRYNDIYPQRDTPDRTRPGVNAAELAARFLTAVGQLERDWGCRKPAHPLLPPGITTINPGVVQVGSGIGANGLPVTMTNPAITPDVAVLDFDLKYSPTENSAQVRAEFEEFVRSWAAQDSWLRETPPIVQWELGSLHFPAFDTPLDFPLVDSIRRQRTALGRSAEITGFVAVCDGAFYRGAGATPLIHGPLGADAHGPDEWVSVESIVDTAKVYAAAAIEYCGLRAG
ncbi:acetylornithine deacetylase [Tamaricihabitans halophyticus]|uniref:Probable succinyl-diaminopimelate desuccinylase n=1 Tax=Tamaricihabitans halophyticus TaxID=1262583 RepID=A0A4R2QZC7_9PSEU|nr:ArgE/DapE family deacylase [Tamaricihabitans halophyticus]TCP55037.1 acetylornithine deacetylase [Tamaricihabitans halophyticus]